MKKLLVTASVLAVSGAATAGNVLWDQAPNPDDSAFVDQAFADFPDFSTYLVSDVTFGSDITIDSITTYFTNGNLTWPQGGAGTATLNIFADDGALDSEDPASGMSVPVTYNVSATGIDVVASGLGIALGAGTYWVGLTPELDFGVAGQEFHLGAGPVGANTAARNPGGGFGLGTDWFEAGPAFGGLDTWDAALTITGVPAPGALALLGLAGVVGRRRRR